MKFKKTGLCLMLALMLLSTVVLAQSTVRVYVNGTRVNEDVILKDGRTYVPLRAVSESLGAQVDWDQDTSSAHITFTEDDAIAKIVADVSPSVVTIIGNYAGTDEASKFTNPTVHGSGVIYRSNGYILTNAHVVENIKNLTVVLNNGEVAAGQLLFSDSTIDLAIVKISKIGLTPILMADAQSIVTGKTAIAIGTPISLTLRNSVTKGIISGNGVALEDSHYKLLQTDATINPGNSGGPLLNTKGELIGINSSKYAGIGIENLGFAIPVDTVQYAISQYETHGKILRPDFKLTLENSWEAKIGLPTTKGVTVKTSANGVLQAGDTVLSVNGIAVHSIADFNEALKLTYNGTDAQFVYMRGGQTLEAKITG